MISNAAYGELKKRKEENKGFSDVIMELLGSHENKTGYGLRKYLGILKGDKEYKKIQKELKAGWSRWSTRYA